MKSFSAWPRWVQILVASLAVLAALAAGVALEYRSMQPRTQGKSALAQQFETQPKAWLGQPRDASDLERSLAQHDVAAIGVDERRLFVSTRGGERYSVEVLPGKDGGQQRLEALSREQDFALTRITVDARSPREKLLAAAAQVMDRGAGVLTVLVLAVIGVYVIRNSGAMGSGNKLQLAEKPETDFDDVIGSTEAKAALQQVTAFMRNPQKYLALGAKPPRGVLLEGPPGTGKTLLARALAGECGANFIAVDGSHFSSMFYGAGITKVKELFATARKHSPCIVFIDEFDGIGKRASGSKVQGGQSEENRIINKLLVEMDGFSPSDNIIVIGATNHVGNVDDALKRPGRFDLVARVALPTVNDRRELIDLLLGKVKAASGIDVDALARSSSGLSHADITNVVNRAAVLAAEAGAEAVTADFLHRALETHQLGGEVSALKSMMSPAHRQRIAIHESGHAIVAHVMGAGTVERISIEPRGPALGVTFVTRADEVPLYGEQELNARIGMLLAGREAELMVFGNTTSGASDDLKRASELAIEMVSSMGFSSEFGLLSLNGVPENLVGPHIQERALGEARLLLERSQAQCRAVLERHKDVLEALTASLLKDETVSGQLLREWLPLGEVTEIGHGRMLKAATSVSEADAGATLA